MQEIANIVVRRAQTLLLEHQHEGVTKVRQFAAGQGMHRLGRALFVLDDPSRQAHVAATVLFGQGATLLCRKATRQVSG